MVRQSSAQSMGEIRNSNVGFSSITDAMSDAEMSKDVDGVIEVSGSPPSFDDFERIEKTREEVKESKKAPQEKEPKKEIKKDETEVKKEKVAEEGRKTEDDGESDKENTEEKQEGASETKSKILKAKLGDKEIDLTGEETIDVKVNGEIQQVKISELRNNYAGKVGWDKKFTELDKKSKADLQKLQHEKESLYKPLQQFEKLVQEGKAGDAILHLVDFVGQDSYAFRKNLVEAMTPIVKARLEMSPGQLEAYEAKMEVEHLRQKEKSVLERSKREQTQKELAQRTAKLQETYSISDDDFRSSAEKYKELLTRDGKFSQETYNPESVAQFYLATKASEKLFNTISKIDRTLEQDSHLIQEAMKLLMEAPDLTENDLREIILEYRGVNEKLKVATQKAGVVEKFTPPQDRHDEKVNFFEDFE